MGGGGGRGVLSNLGGGGGRGVLSNLLMHLLEFTIIS